MTWLATFWRGFLALLAYLKGARDQAAADAQQAALAAAQAQAAAGQRATDAVSAAAAQDRATDAAHARIQEDIAHADTYPQVVTDPTLLAALRGLRARQAARGQHDPAA